MAGIRKLLAVAVLGAGLSAAPAAAQVVPWIAFDDPFSSSVCDVVNAANAELVVLVATGELVIVTGPDVILTHTLVDVEGFVYFDGILVGLIDFQEDGNGLRTLWWVSLTGSVVDVDPFSGVPTDSGFLPGHFVNVPCDACEFWDDAADCIPVVPDTDADGVPDLVDDCPGTPLDEVADLGGCSCSQLDGDLDDLDDCEDFCPDTPLGEPVDFDGCACFEVDDDDDGVDNCDDECPHTLPGDIADDFGCGCLDLDGDDDGVSDCDDFCPSTSFGVEVGVDGCAVDPDDGPDGVITIGCGAAGMLMWTLMLVGLVGLRGSRVVG